MREADLQKALSMFFIEYTSIFNQYFLLVIKRSFKNSKNWFDEDLIKLVKEKDKLFKTYIAKKTTVAKAKHKEARNKYLYSIQEKKEAFYASILKK